MRQIITTKLGSILLAGLCAYLPMLSAAEPPPGQTASSVASPVILDRSKPIQVDLWSGPPKEFNQAVTKAGIDPKTMNELSGKEPSQAYNLPMLIGAVLVGKEIHRPFASAYVQWYSPYLGLYNTGGNCMYSFFNFRHVKEDVQEFSCVMDSTTIRGKAKVDYGGKQPIEVVWEGKVEGDKITGSSAFLVDGKRLERSLYGILRNTVYVDLDHMNAIYQLQLGERRDIEVVIEVAAGKPVAALAHHIDLHSGNALLDVDASGLTLELQPATTAGRSVLLGGTLVVDKKSFKLKPVLVNQVGRVLSQLSYNNSVDTRAYANTDPIAKRWKEWMTTVYSGSQALPAELVTQSIREAQELDALPAPGPATAFFHFHYYQGLSFIYAPWLDFKPVAGADHYRFEVTPKETKATRTFESQSPTASFRPIWADMPINRQITAVCTAMDAAGKPIGQPEKRSFVKRNAFGQGTPPGKPIPDPIATQLALRYPRALAGIYYNHLPLFTQVMSYEPGAIKHERNSDIIRDPNRCLSRWGESPSERALGLSSAETFFRLIATETERGPMGFTEGYKGGAYLYFSIFQDWGRQIMDEYEASGKADRLATMRGTLVKLQRIQQPSGSWTFLRFVAFPDGTGGFTLFGNPWMDHNSAAYALGYGRYRRLSGDGDFLDAEIKANHWLARNALRTGYWEQAEQQGGPGQGFMRNVFAHDFLLYMLEYAPPDIANLPLAEDVARLLEDAFVQWNPIPSIDGGNMTETGHMRMAIVWLHLYRQTGKPIYLAKAEAFFTSYMQLRNPVEGLSKIEVHRYDTAKDDPWYALRYVELRQQIQAEKTNQKDPANATVVVNLDQAVEGRERVILHLDCQGGKVQRAVATTPTWDHQDIPFTQPGRLHHHDGTQLFHPVDAGKLTVGANGVQGEVTVTLTPFTPGAVAKPTVFVLDAKPDFRMLNGTWTAGKSTGRASAEIRGSAQSSPKRVHLEIAKAVTGGEAWQNWALSQFNLKDGKTTSTLNNNNAGWRATVDTSNLTLSRDAMTASMKVTVAWRGFMDNKAAKEAKTAEWKAGNLDWLVYWKQGEGPDDWFEPCFRPLPWPEGSRRPDKRTWDPKSQALKVEPWPPGTTIEEMEKRGGLIEYKTSFTPVAAGVYEYRFAGQRVGDVIAGTVTVKDPDGKERSCQCFGGVE